MMLNVFPLGTLIVIMYSAIRGCIKDLEALINDILYGINVIADIIIEHLLIMSAYKNHYVKQQ